MQETGIFTAAKELGIPFVQTVLIFVLMRRQDEKHVKDMDVYAETLDAIRKENDNRAMRMHDRMNQLMIEVLSVVRENSKIMATMVTLMQESERD